ncbi:hypothetical protein F0L74_14005 [Chitinophaga agrisoli]|uniref:Uncharacterized protein n=1 Tax=Chitinophaga agrisoli TaxID=2607653 RepID=A0A5B2VZM6_9BACT|nr:hypothetical protein [Chitinophaga agrisoli]KAA2243597.1 hypothetical protein F0L74_14005 [Chitinophaga agrisoli]
MDHLKSLRLLSFSSIGMMALTSLHHAYGAVVYHTPWRLHVLFVSVPVIVLLAILDITMRRHGVGRWQLRTYLLLLILFPLLSIGVYEGAYNHAAKDLLYLLHLPAATFDKLFPSSMYEKPNDVFFELTGVLQAIILWPLVKSLVRLLRELRSLAAL